MADDTDTELSRDEYELRLARANRHAALQEAVKAIKPEGWNMRDTGTYRREILDTAHAFENYLKTGATR